MCKRILLMAIGVFIASILSGCSLVAEAMRAGANAAHGAANWVDPERKPTDMPSAAAKEASFPLTKATIGRATVSLQPMFKADGQKVGLSIMNAMGDCASLEVLIRWAGMSERKEMAGRTPAAYSQIIDWPKLSDGKVIVICHNHQGKGKWTLTTSFALDASGLFDPFGTQQELVHGKDVRCRKTDLTDRTRMTEWGACDNSAAAKPARRGKGRGR